jgi:hypothetical protein
MTAISFAQEEQLIWRTGLMYTTGTQQAFPFNSKDYTYDVRGYKAVINRELWRKGVFSYELQFEPGIYRANHQLLNEYFVQPDYGPDYMELREIYTQEKTIMEYVINVGFEVRANITESFSMFIIGSIGPMISDTETERLADGFAFSDILAIGAAYQTGRMMFEVRPGVRHVSNADLQFPNCGHNSTNIDFSVSFRVK